MVAGEVMMHWPAQAGEVEVDPRPEAGSFELQSVSHEGLSGARDGPDRTKRTALVVTPDLELDSGARQRSLPRAHRSQVCCLISAHQSHWSAQTQRMAQREKLDSEARPERSGP